MANEVRSRQARYLTPYQISALPAPSWLLQDILPDNALTVLYGAPKTGKSMLALDWSLCLSLGMDWYGKKSKGPTKVLYVAGEGVGGLGRRVAAWTKHRHRTLAPTSPIFRDLIVNLRASAWLDVFIKELQERPEGLPELIVIDTLAKAMVGGDENSAEDMGLAVDGADRIRHATGASVLLIHHTTKASDTVMRGSSALLGGADAVLCLEKHKVEGTLGLVMTAARDFESGASTELRAMPSDAGIVLVPAGAYTPPTVSEAQYKLLLVLAEELGMNTKLSREDWKEASGLSDTYFARLLSSLEPYTVKTLDGRKAFFELSRSGEDVLTELYVEDKDMELDYSEFENAEQEPEDEDERR